MNGTSYPSLGAKDSQILLKILFWRDLSIQVIVTYWKDKENIL